MQQVGKFVRQKFSRGDVAYRYDVTLPIKAPFLNKGVYKEITKEGRKEYKIRNGPFGGFKERG